MSGGDGDCVKALLLRPSRYCGRDMLIRKLQKFTIQNVSLNAAIEERRNIKIASNFSIAASNFSIAASIFFEEETAIPLLLRLPQ